MQGRTHEIGAMAAALAIAPLTHIQNNNTLVYAGFLICAGIRGLLPDADLPNSTIGKKIFPLAWPMYLIRRILNLLKRFIPSLEKITRLMAHRGICHTPIMWFVILLPSFIFLRPGWRIYLIGLSVGIVSHLLLDSISGGIPVLFPFTMKRIHIPGIRVKTGGAIEFVIMIILFLYCMAKLAAYIKGVI